jgi:hypothetical protein
MRRAGNHTEARSAQQRSRKSIRSQFLTALSVGFAGWASVAHAEAPTTMQPLPDEELASVRGNDGVAFNLSNFSLISIPSNPLNLTYSAPGGGSLTLGRLDLSRTDDADPFADPFFLTMRSRAGLPDVVAIDFPLNPVDTGNQKWTLTADFSNCSLFSGGTCTGTNFDGGTLQIQGLALRGGGLYLSSPTIPNTQGVAFGLGTRLDIDTLGIYPHGRALDDTIDRSESLTLNGIHLADATTGGAWMLADVTNHPGLFNAQTSIDPVTGNPVSYLHLQVGWPTVADAVPAASFKVDTITFTSGGAPAMTMGTAAAPAVSIASMQINYIDIKLKP